MSSERKKELLTVTGYGAVTLLVFAFGQIYEYFGFGVTSPFMHLAFLIPLAAGMLPALLVFLTGCTERIAPVSRVLLRLGIATLTTGSLFRGALDIYGTGSPLTAVYPVAGGALFFAALCSGAAGAKKTVNGL